MLYIVFVSVFPRVLVYAIFECRLSIKFNLVVFSCILVMCYMLLLTCTLVLPPIPPALILYMFNGADSFMISVYLNFLCMWSSCSICCFILR